MSKIYDKCPNCKSTIREEKGVFKGVNKIIPLENYQQIKEFISDDGFINEAYCESCAYTLSILESSKSLVRKYHDFFVRHPKKTERGELSSKINKLEKDSDSTRVRIIKSFLNNVTLYSNNHNNFESVSLVEGFKVVDSGMWSTSSDNLDAMWSVVHDAAARKGEKSNSKISEGLNDVKDLIKMEAINKKCNTVLDLRFNFSELAGNGKILIFCQGTAAINTAKKLPDFSSLEKEFNLIKTYKKTLEEIEHFLTYKSPDALIDFIKTLKK
tara:strand:+ start:244 stop:1053 length:810 start_codon:yes stop_codon:yes gene_type:complete